MAKTKAEAVQAENPLKKPKGFAISPIRGSEEWGDWVTRLAKFDRGSCPDVIDRALALYAKTIGFPDPPPER